MGVIDWRMALSVAAGVVVAGLAVTVIAKVL